MDRAASLQPLEEQGHRGLQLSVLVQSPGVRHLFGLRGSRPLEVLAEYFGVRHDQVATIRQVHGDSIWVTDSPAGGDYDAVVTNRPGLVITVRTADCLPILIWDEHQKVVAAVHAGWRGSLKAIASKTVFMMQSHFGSRPQDLLVGIGPAVGPCCYEVDGPVLRPLRERFDFWREVVRQKGPDKGMLDLPALNVRQLIGSGVPSERITVAGACTVCHPERFQSYRRDGHSGNGMISGIMVCPVKNG